MIDKLKQESNFTETEQRIAEYILDNQLDMAKITVQDLAKRAYSSHSAVIRLTKKLGFSGFKDFRVVLVKEVQDNQHVISNVNANFPFTATDSAFEIAKNMADLSIESIQKTADKLDKHNLEKVAKILIKSKRIFLFGTGDSQIRARSFQNKFNKIDRYPIVAGEYGEGSWHSLNLDKNDSGVFISYSGRSHEFVQYLNYLKHENRDTILITGDTDSEMAKLSKYVIEVPQTEYNFVKVGTFASQLSFEYVLDTLFAIIYESEYTKNLVDIMKKEKITNKNFDN
ncbi:MurR/RpiR family transcriptional regulator [Companilactobacillus allii]|uniref:MurR/RpiR family transcriptional regulator n=1 Tax=Companilactobacillus allii TaxID=1847728 RepID=UPI00208E190A|nr:MurR/RpiR family transcriptional regulator [Companilactobacillus allii]USQ67752.1 MurR/RpiR family transcriptional regulator [Companilactobacillus allii]